MGDAARKGADGLHLLRLIKLLFEFFLQGHVPHKVKGRRLLVELDQNGIELHPDGHRAIPL